MKIIDNMKKIIKKRKAFTLVELMGVLVLLGVLTAILIPVIGNNLKENKENVYNYLISSIELASKNLASDHMFILPTEEGSSVYITLGQLKSLSYIEEVTNPITKKELSDCTLIEIKKTDNNYEYVINENTFENFDCTVNSGISISQPSNEYIKNAKSTDYIVIVNSDDEDMFKKYNINNSKINLIGSAAEGAKYLINGENRIYKISLIGGEIEGTLSFELTSGAITDESGNDIVGNNPLSPVDSILVDNTAPIIVFGTDGDDSYKRNLSSTITVTDRVSQVDSSTLKYIYTQDINGEPSAVFTNGSKVEISVGNGLYYLRAKACDNAGNCTVNTSKTFNLDNQAPVITLTRGNYGSNEWAGIGFKKGDYTLLGTAEENGSGIAYWQYTYNANASEDNCGDSSKCWISYNNDSINKNNALTSIETTKFSAERNQLVYIRACDNVGNCSDKSSEIIKIDLTAPVAPTVALVQGNWAELNNNTWYQQDVYVSGKADGNDPNPTSNDSLSGIKKYQISSDNSTWYDWKYQNPLNLYYINTEGITYRYVRAVDNAGNVSEVTKKTIKIDKTAPVITHVSTTNNTELWGYTYHKVTIIRISDNTINNISGHRAHCAAVNASSANPQENACFTSSGATTYNAYNRLNYYLNNSQGMTIDGKLDNKIASFSNSGTVPYDLYLPTNMGKGVAIQFAIRACDEAGNCTAINNFTV